MRLDRFCCLIALSIVAENLLKGQFLEPDGNPKVVVTCARQILCPESEPKIESEVSRNHLVANHDFSLQPVFTTKWVRKVIL